MARQYFVEIGQPQRALFIARRQSYHGNTLGALAVGGNEWRRRQFAPLLIDVTHVSPCYAYRDRRDGETPEAYGERLAAELDAAIRALGPERVIAFVAETVVGATAGVLTPVPGYFKRGARDLRPPRRAADPRRGDVRHGPHRHAARLRAGGRRARPHGDRQGPGRRLPADRRRAGAAADRRRDVGRQRLLPARPHLPRPPGRLRRGARRAAGDRARRPARARPRARAPRFAARLREAFGDHPHVGDIRGRGLLLGRRAGGRPRDQGAVRPGAAAARAGQARGDGARADVLPDGRHHRRPRRATTSCSRRRSSPGQPNSTKSSAGCARPSTPRSQRFKCRCFARFPRFQPAGGTP